MDKHKSSSICKHYFSEHNSNVSPCLLEQFHVVRYSLEELVLIATLYLSRWSLVIIDFFVGCVLQRDKGWSSTDAWSDRPKAGRFIGSS